jgi:hypothetical protein
MRARERTRQVASTSTTTGMGAARRLLCRHPDGPKARLPPRFSRARGGFLPSPRGAALRSGRGLRPGARDVRGHRGRALGAQSVCHDPADARDLRSGLARRNDGLQPPRRKIHSARSRRRSVADLPFPGQRGRREGGRRGRLPSLARDAMALAARRSSRGHVQSPAHDARGLPGALPEPARLREAVPANRACGIAPPPMQG